MRPIKRVVGCCKHYFVETLNLWSKRLKHWSNHISTTAHSCGCPKREGCWRWRRRWCETSQGGSQSWGASWATEQTNDEFPVKAVRELPGSVHLEGAGAQPWAYLVIQSFQSSGPRLWNSLPKNIRNKTKCSQEDFKEMLEIFLAKVPDEPRASSCEPDACDPHSGRATKTLMHQVKRRRGTWRDLPTTWL